MAEKKTDVVKTEEQKEKAPVQANASERFTAAVMKEFGTNVSGAVEVSEYQKRLIQGYFIWIDRALKAAEEERVRKNDANKDHKFDNPLPVSWQTVNLSDLAIDLVHYAKLGLDMNQDNMLNPIPFRNTKRGQYDVTLMEGYNGIRYIAEHYAVEIPKAVTVEVVYSNDSFKPIKKGASNPIENYEFEIVAPFDRGDIVGGFAYIEFTDPAKNELVILSMRDIEKRKPRYASAEFWGGKKKIWENGKQIEVETDGWLDEMVRKTLIREAYSAKHLPRDPRKIDDVYQYLKLREAKYAEMAANAEVAEKANVVFVDADGETGVNTETGEIAQIEEPAASKIEDNKMAPTGKKVPEEEEGIDF